MPYSEELIQTGLAPEYFCSGSSRVEVIGPNVRLVFYVEQQGFDRTTERHVNVTVVMPIRARGALIEQLAAVESACGKARLAS